MMVEALVAVAMEMVVEYLWAEEITLAVALEMVAR